MTKQDQFSSEWCTASRNLLQYPRHHILGLARVDSWLSHLWCDLHLVFFSLSPLTLSKISIMVNYNTCLSLAQEAKFGHVALCEVLVLGVFAGL